MSDRMSRLEASRDHLGAAIEGCDSNRDLPALVREYRAVMAEIDSLAPPAQEGDAFDEIAARRAARGASPTARKTRSN